MQVLFCDPGSVVYHIQIRALGALVHAAFKAHVCLFAGFAAVADPVVNEVCHCLSQLAFVNPDFRIFRLDFDFNFRLSYRFFELGSKFLEIVLQLQLDWCGWTTA